MAGKECISIARRSPYYGHHASRRIGNAAIRATELADTFLDRADVESCAREVVTVMRASMLDCARWMTLAVAPLTTADECEAVIERGHCTLLEGMVRVLAETGSPTMLA